MLKRMTSAAHTVALGERGQVTVEYALVVSVVAALLLGVSAMVMSGLSSHYREITSVVCLPLP